jgi:hypothetical protein
MDGMNFVATTYQSEKPNVLEMIRAAEAKFQKIKTREVPDIILLTRNNFEKLKKQFGQENPHVDESKLDRISGIPFEVFETEFEMNMRALELVESGKRCLVCK